jgi:hypothetical protein
LSSDAIRRPPKPTAQEERWVDYHSLHRACPKAQVLAGDVEDQCNEGVMPSKTEKKDIGVF